MYKKLSLYIIALLVLSSNAFAQKKKKKEAAVEEQQVVVKTDTVYLDKKPELPEPKIYQASNPRSNDLLHTKLEVKFDWQNSWMFGKAWIDIKPYFNPVKKLYLNARGMDIYKVQLVGPKGNIDLKYVYENDSLKIDLDKEYTRNDKYTVFIDYKSKPNELKLGGSQAINSDKGLYFINPKGEEKNKMPQIWTQGETQSNSAWVPTVDSPNERMTDEIYITVDDKYITLSNGLLTKQTKNADGTRTDYWKMDIPHAPYLLMMGIGEFKKVVDKPWNGKEVSYYVEKEYEPYAKGIFGNTGEMIEFFSKKLGVPYAWPKYSQIVVRDYVSGAMENTSATLHGDFSVYQTDREMLDGKRGENVISHELFHQWFGDLVTCESWSNITVNESFATYGEYLWQEYKNGADAADAHSWNSRQGYMAQSKMDPLVRFGYTEREEVFDAISYNKGGQILHMLRKYVGDDAFFASLKLYLETNKFKNAEAHNLRLAFEEVTGEDLNWFWNQWYFAGGYPELKIENSYDSSAKQVKVKITQQQDFTLAPLFKIPVYIDLYYGEGAAKKVVRKRVTINKVNEEFAFTSDEKPSLINFDGEKQLLCSKSENKTLAEYVYQYKNAPKYVDRLEALDKFKANLSDALVYECVKLALKDKWHTLRIKAINLLDEVAAKNETDLKTLLISIAKTDEKTTVRAEAIEFLSKNYKGDDVKEIYTAAIGEQSFAIMGSGMAALAKNDPQAAMKKAKDLENIDSDNIRFTLMDLYSNYGGDENNGFFLKNKDNFSGFMSMGFINMYGQFLKRCSDANVVAGAEIIKGYTAKGKGSSYVRYVAQKVLKDFYNNYQDKEDELVSKKDDASVKRLGEVTATKNKLKAILDEAKQ
ncbi:MAG TPA: M1 family metallopeptidase [Bacteroidia bacterium]|jgi:aminopeptidase N|nr:M1 family metallopeptidase [Bacteroidia bacterium]